VHSEFEAAKSGRSHSRGNRRSSPSSATLEEYLRHPENHEKVAQGLGLSFSDKESREKHKEETQSRLEEIERKLNGGA